MSEAAAAVVRPEAVVSLIQNWVDSFSQVLGQIAGFVVPCALLTEAPAEATPVSERDFWILCTCAGGLRGEMSLRLDPVSALRAAQTFMSEPAAPDAELTPQHREAILECLRQVAGIVATSLKDAWGEVQLRLDAASGPPSWPPSSTSWVRSGGDVPATMLLELHLSAALGAALRAVRAEAAESQEATTPAIASGPQDNEAKLELLMDVELALTLRFGGRNLLLRDVLELCPGAVIELDRQVHEPVDVLLDGRLLARGEVVVMDGNYGLRVTEVAPPGSV